MQAIDVHKIKIIIWNHKKLSLLCAIILVSIVWMAFTGTLSYPFIMLDRQVQSITDCTFGTQDFSTNAYNSRFIVPDGFCVLPNRLFPLDGSIEIVPKGWYFVFNEYAKGTVAEGSVATILYEPVVPDRDPNHIIQSLVSGKFLDPNQVTSTTTSTGIHYVFASATGTDGKLYDWAFSTRPDNKFFVALVKKHEESGPVWNELLNSLTFF